MFLLVFNSLFQLFLLSVSIFFPSSISLWTVRHIRPSILVWLSNKLSWQHTWKMWLKIYCSSFMELRQDKVGSLPPGSSLCQGPGLYSWCEEPSLCSVFVLKWMRFLSGRRVSTSMGHLGQLLPFLQWTRQAARLVPNLFSAWALIKPAHLVHVFWGHVCKVMF